MKCRNCDRAMVSDRAWRSLPPKGRQTGGRHRGRGLCSPCYLRASRDGSLEDWPKTTSATPYADLVVEVERLVFEEWVWDIGEIAKTLNRTRESISLALRRGARRGDARAIALRSRLELAP